MPKQTTYRLTLTDSNNISVFIDVELKNLTTGSGKLLVDLYKKEVKEYEDAQKKSVENDKEVAKRLEDNKNKLNVKEETKLEDVDDGDSTGDEDELTEEEVADLEE